MSFQQNYNILNPHNKVLWCKFGIHHTKLSSFELYYYLFSCGCFSFKDFASKTLFYVWKLLNYIFNMHEFFRKMIRSCYTVRNIYLHCNCSYGLFQSKYLKPLTQLSETVVISITRFSLSLARHLRTAASIRHLKKQIHRFFK